MAGFDTGDLDQRVRFERQVIDGNQERGEEPWEHAFTVWGKLQDILPSRAERSAEAINLATRPATLWIMNRAGVDSAMRVIVAGRTMQIIAGPAYVRSCDGLEMRVEDHSSSGGEE